MSQLTVGQKVTHVEFGAGSVIKACAIIGLFSILFEDGEKFVAQNSQHITTIDGIAVKNKATTKRNSLPTEISPSIIPTNFIAHCHVAGVSIQLQFPEHDETRARQVLEANGIVFPVGARPIQFGIRGGSEELQTRTFKLRASTPIPADTSIIPVKYHAKDGMAAIYNTEFVLGLLVAGFPITSANEERI
jgi:hypothetical protein